MRRFASVFKRKETVAVPDPSSTLSTPQLSIASDKAHSSASSSSHSASLPTPVDELPVPLRSWRSWIGAKRSNSFKRNPPPRAIPDWPPKPDSDEDEEEEDEDDYGHDLLPSALPHARAPQNLEILLRNSLVPPLPVPPFVQHSLGPFFPRSSNRPALLSPQPDTRTTMFRKHLLARLHREDLSPADLSSIRPFGPKQQPPLLSPPTPSFPDSSYPSPTTKTFPASPGIRRWIHRACFEDRHQILVVVDDVLQSRPVSATHAVAALEYSELLDVMVDPDFDLFPCHKSTAPDPEPTIPATLSHAPTQESQPLSAPLPPQKRNSYTAAPSPLRNSNSPPTLKQHALSEPAPAKSAVKRLVRFAEDDSDGDDSLPLHVVRMKKKREQKASFLRQERLKREKEEEEERRLRELEARQREQDVLEMERRRQAQEKERKDREKAMYAESIAATRLRRETVRAGGTLGSSSNTTSNSNLLVPSPSSASLKDAERNKPTDSISRRFSRVPPGHDGPPSISIPRREVSDPAVYLHQQYLSDSSPGSSRPPSIGYSPVSLNSPVPGHHSRPPSTYSAQTSSSEDVRLQGGSKRNSVTAAVAAGSGGSLRGHQTPMIVSYPTWSGSNPNISTSYIPPIPPFPDYVHDMPLLPPTAPFMKSPYKPRSASSRNVSPGAASTSSGSRRGSFNSSTERVDRVPVGPGPPQTTPYTNPSSSSPHPTPRRQSSASASTPARPPHHRQDSSDSRNTSWTHQTTKTAPHSPQQRPPPATSRSQPTLSRGRPLQPQYLQAPSSWMSPGPLPSSSTQMMGGQPTAAIPMFVPVPVPVMPYGNVGMSMSAGNLQQMQMGMQMQMQMQAAQGMGMGFGGGMAEFGGGGTTGSRSVGAGGSTRSKRQTQPVVS